jgi:para-nitrobenzyl esterase
MDRTLVRRSAFFCGTLIVVQALSPGRLAAQAGAGVAEVRVESGAVSGVTRDGIESYRGLPYAAPPVGDRRWRAPELPLAWTGVRQAVDYGPSCPQQLPVRRVPFGSRAETTSEDCLTLNVWTPAVRAAPLPVMVWLHGGGNDSGTGSQTYYDGSAFARDGVVLVTLNYRLGLLGFFAHPALTREAGNAATGNFGLLDQIAALRWVHANIAAFGGDPSNITLAGESAGGNDVLALASSDEARGLFARGIVESAPGVADRWPTLAEAEMQGTKLATSLGLPGERATAAQLRALSADALAQVSGDQQIGPMVDGTLERAQLATSLAGGARVPLIIGSNAGDGSEVGTMDIGAALPQLTPDDVAFVRARYRERGITDDAAMTEQLFGDAFFGVPARWVAARAASGIPAYLYRFDYVLSLLASRRKTATHGSEIPFVFENWPLGISSETDRTVGAALHECWVTFARTGTPACTPGSAWPPYDARNPRLMVFDAQPSARDPGDGAVMDRLEPVLVPR